MVSACLQVKALSVGLQESTSDSLVVAPLQDVVTATEPECATLDPIYSDFQPGPPDVDPEAETQILLDRLGRGDSSGFWRIWGRHQKYLFGLCLRQMGGVQEDAEDALSRAMLKALEKLPHYACSITDVRAWLARLVSNLCVDIHRERRRRTRATVSLEEMMATDKEPVPPRTKTPEETLLSREILRCVTRAVEQLPARLREPFMLRFLQETPYREISERLALSNDNARKRVQQARAIVREQLDLYLTGLVTPK